LVAKETVVLKMTKLQIAFSQNGSFQAFNFEPPQLPQF
jgi:hypothetical protein